jgi:hypothetical protein
MVCYYLCYARGLGLKGLWIGWIIGLTANSGFSLYLLLTRKERHHLEHRLTMLDLKEIKEDPNENKENEDVYGTI